MVRESSPSESHHSHPLFTPTPANDNSIPLWNLIGDEVKAVCATAALQIDDNPAIAFSFNLTPEAITKAKGDPDGFLDALKRPFDQNLKRAGIALPYFFAIDIDADERLHLHGAFRNPAPDISITLTRIRIIMKDSWGEWTVPGKHKQLHFQLLRDDHWASYCLRNGKAVRKIIGPRNFTITKSLKDEAEWFYKGVRSIMRGL